jgi:hypothetical protein
MESDALIRADGAVALYLDLPPTDLVDLEVAASAVIEWVRGLRAAATTLDPDFDYRVSLIAAQPGSSKWLAAVERSPINQGAERLKRGWGKVPLIFRWTIALAVALPTTAVPTYRYWTGTDEGFNDAQLKQLEETIRKVADEPAVKSHRQSMYVELQRDRKIAGVGTGIARSSAWKPEPVS